jgi:hypothetical protein
MSISCLVTVYSMVCADYCVRWNLLNFDMVQCIGRNACRVSVRDTKTVRSGYWHTTQKVACASCQCDGEEMHSGYRCAEKHFTL